MAPVGRIHRLSTLLLHRVHSAVMERHGLAPHDFDILAAIYRSGPPFQQSPGELLRAMMVTSGTVTHRIDRMEKMGFVVREPATDDRRSILVKLTQAGCSAVLAALEDHLESERAVLAGLTAAEQQQLNQLLKKLILPLE